jgi:hypothetical protein
VSFRQAFASLLHLFVLFSFFVAGVFFIALSRLSELREKIFQMEDFTYVALLFFATSALLFIGFFAINQGKYLRVRMGVDVHTKVIRQTIEKVFQKHNIPLHEVGVFRNKLEITVLGMEGLEEVEQELTALFQKRFGYTKPFYLIVKK